MKLTLRELFLLVVIAAMGCWDSSNKPLSVKPADQSQPFSGVIRFVNESEKDIWVDRLEGFERNWACGQLGAGQDASVHLDPKPPLPDRLVVTWKTEGMVKASTFTLRDLTRNGMDDELVFEFTNEDTCLARFGTP